MTRKSCIMFFVTTVLFGSVSLSRAANIMPSGVLVDSLTASQHPFYSQINSFNKNQAGYTEPFTPTGLTRSEYLRLILSIARAMKVYQNSAGQIVDPVRGREFQYATPCYAHAVSAVFAGKYSTDTALLSSGMRAMDAAISHMLNNDVPDGHGDFFTVPLMQAYWNYKNVPGAASKLATWRTDLGKINPSVVYHNSAPNWIGINMTGEFMRYVEGLTTVTYTTDRILYQISRIDPDGLYEDADPVESLTVANIDGNSFPYDNVARGILGMTAVNGYNGVYYQELQKRLWKGVWTALLYQSPFGEVPTGMRSSHHFWNEAEAAMSYEMWAAQYKAAGKAEIAGAFKRAAMLALSCIGKWLRPDGSGYVTKARYPIAAQWGYMTYSSHTQYNLWCASAMAMAWQQSDSTIAEKPAPCDIGGFVLPVLLGFNKVFANAGGSYIEFDVRGDHAHNPTGLNRLHLKTSYPQLGPSDGAVGQVIAGAQYWPLYPETDPSGLSNLSVGPAYMDGSGSWYPLAELQQIPTVSTLLQTPQKSSFRLAYSIYGSATLYETIVVEPQGVTVVDSIVGGSHSQIRVNYPLLLTDGIDTTKYTITGNQLTAQLKGKGVQFKVNRPAGATLSIAGTPRNHRNGKCDRVSAIVSGRVAEYYVSAWPEYQTTASRKPSGKSVPKAVAFSRSFGCRIVLPETAKGPYTVTFYSLDGSIAARYDNIVAERTLLLSGDRLPRASGIFRALITGAASRWEGSFVNVR